jgi:hypothetical protein
MARRGGAGVADPRTTNTNNTTTNITNNIIPIPTRVEPQNNNNIITNNITNPQDSNSNLLGRKRESENELVEPSQMNELDRNNPNRQSDNNISHMSSYDMIIEEYVEDDGGNISNTESEN